MNCSAGLGTGLHYQQPPPFRTDGILGGIEDLLPLSAIRWADEVFWLCAAFDPPLVSASGRHREPFPARQHKQQLDGNNHRSRQITAGLLLLLASCGWVLGGEEGIGLAIARAAPLPGRASINRNTGHGHFPLRRLSPAEAPELFQQVELMCRRAKLRRLPEICVLVGQEAMNAYALGGPDDAIITLTEGLLRGMTMEEAAAICAHEIAHVYNDDGSTMTWAADLQRAINDVSAAGLNSAAFCPSITQSSLFWLLRSAPALAELLVLALSRSRELEADALALELTGDPKTLAGALSKLERHHRAINRVPAGYTDDYLSSYLRSHPLTSERIGRLRASSMYGQLVSAYAA